jgi:hypothetical protein
VRSLTASSAHSVLRGAQPRLEPLLLRRPSTGRLRGVAFYDGTWAELEYFGLALTIDCEHVPSAADMASAMRLNEDWDRHRRGLPPKAADEQTYPRGSIGEAYLRIMRLREAGRRAKGIVWTKEQTSRDDWPRAWKWIGELLGDCDPKSVTPEQLIGDPLKSNEIGLRPLVATKVSETEAHRVIKVWRALWQRMAALRYCDKDHDPSFQFANTAPQPRQAV